MVPHLALLMLVSQLPPAEPLPVPQAIPTTPNGVPQPVLPPIHPQADPDATAQFRAALESRATWTNFPGLEANLDVRHRGQMSRGVVRVGVDGNVVVAGLDPTTGAWLDEKLSFIVKQRLPQNLRPDAVYLEPEQGNPLGRAMRVLADPYNTIYRLQAGQIQALERTAPAGRLVILVQRNDLNAEGKQLPTAYTAHFWGPLNGALMRTESYTQSWARFGEIDLPTRILITIARNGALEVDQIVLRDYRLGGGTPPAVAPIPGLPPGGE